VIVEINTDSTVWSAVKHALREAGYKYFLQEQLYSPNKTLFVEPRAMEPEGGKLSHGLLVYQGGAIVDSHVQEVYSEEIQK
jgi:hypothetical protein